MEHHMENHIYISVEFKQSLLVRYSKKSFTKLAQTGLKRM